MKRSTLFLEQSTEPVILCRTLSETRRQEAKQAERLVQKVLAGDLSMMPSVIESPRLVDSAFQHANQALVQTFADPSTRPSVAALVAVVNGDDLLLCGTEGWQVFAIGDTAVEQIFPGPVQERATMRPEGHLLGLDAAVATCAAHATPAGFHSLVALPTEIAITPEACRAESVERRLATKLGTEAQKACIITLSDHAPVTAPSGRRRAVLLGMSASAAIFLTMVCSHLLSPRSRDVTREPIVFDERPTLPRGTFTRVDEIPSTAIDLAEHTHDIGSIIRTLEQIAADEAIPAAEKLVPAEDNDTLQDLGLEMQQDLLEPYAVELVSENLEQKISDLEEKIARQASMLEARDEEQQALMAQLEMLCSSEATGATERTAHIGEIGELSAELNETKSILHDRQQILAQLEAELLEAHAQMDEDEVLITAHTAEINDLANQLASTANILRDREKELVGLREVENQHFAMVDRFQEQGIRIADLEKQVAEQSQVNKTLSESLASLEFQHDKLLGECDIISLTAEAKGESLTTALANIDLLEVELERLSRHYEELKNVEGELLETQSKLAQFEQAFDQADTERTELQTKCDELLAIQEGFSGLSHEHDQLQIAYEELKARHIAKAEDLNDAEERIAALELSAAELSRVREAYAALQEQYNDLNTCYLTLNNEKESIDRRVVEEIERREVFQAALGNLQTKLSLAETGLEDCQRDSALQIKELQEALTIKTEESDAMIAALTEDHERLADMVAYLQADKIELAHHREALSKQVEEQEALLSARLNHIQDLESALAATQDDYAEEMARLHGTISDFENSITDLEKLMADALTENHELERSLAAEIAAHEQSEIARSELQQHHSDLHAKQIGLAVRVEELEQTLGFESSARERADEELAALKVDHNALSVSYSNLSHREAQLVDQIGDLRDAKQNFAAERERSAQLEQSLAEQASNLHDCQLQLAATQEAREVFQSRLHDLGDAKEQSDLRVNELSATLAQESLEHAALEEKVLQFSDALSERESLIVASESAAAQLATRVNDLQEQRRLLEIDKGNLSHRLEALKHYENEFAREHDLRVQKDDLLTTLAATVQEQKAALNASELSRAALSAEVERLRGLQIHAPAPYARAAQPSRRERRATVTRVHLVAPGETLDRIAERYHRNPEDIYNANREVLPGQHDVPEGTALIIP